MARGDAPLAPPVTSGIAHANRFDALSLDYNVLYFGTDLEVCFGETLARLRPSVALLAVVQKEWGARNFMPVGSIASDWRQRRTAVHVHVPEHLKFVDVESPQTHQFLRAELATGLAALGVSDVDVATVRGGDRRVTQLISQWTYLAAESDEPKYAGIRYESRVKSGWECWAVFEDEDLEIEILESRPITPDMRELQSVAEMFGLQIF